MAGLPAEADRGWNAQTGEWVGPPALTGDDHPWVDPRGIPVPGFTQPKQYIPDPNQVPYDVDTSEDEEPDRSDVFTPVGGKS